MLLDRAMSQLLVVDMQERLAAAIPDIAAVESRCGILIQAARELTVPIVISEQYRKGLGATLPSLMGWAGVNRPFEKNEFSCFANPALREALERFPGRRNRKGDSHLAGDVIQAGHWNWRPA